MEVRALDSTLSACPQLRPEDMTAVAAAGFRAVICNRPDGESPDQPGAQSLGDAARHAGLRFETVPVVVGQIADADVARFRELLDTLPGPVLAFCRTGTRAAMLWALAQASRPDGSHSPDALLETAAAAGYDLGAIKARLAAAPPQAGAAPVAPRAVPGGQVPGGQVSDCDVLIVGGGAAGLATAASLLKRRPGSTVIVADPADSHYYQPGWTLVGAGIFTPAQTRRTMDSVIPHGAHWIRAAVVRFDVHASEVLLADGRRVRYQALVVATGLKLDWDAVEGLRASLGQHGVTSNYALKTASYTWQLVSELKRGVALFTQPPMPIKCAGAPQKAMYLSGSHWRDSGRLDDIRIEFHNAGAVLFGVKEYVPALMEYVARYRADLHFGSRLVAVDGPNHLATFAVTAADGTVARHTRKFDMLHVCPPQCPVEAVSASPLAGEGGWVEVDPATLRHPRFANVFALGDIAGTSNAKTAAATRKQAPVVAENVRALLDGQPLRAQYDGYGSCPLTVERGKVVLAEFGYGGRLMPTFPKWLLDGTRPSRLAWHLKEEILPTLYWKCMLRGREWLCAPALLDENIFKAATDAHGKQ